MAIRVRRGNEADFDANKMLPGEWAVSLDTKYVRMCFAPGVCLRMATYEGFESDMERVEAILEEVESIDEAIKAIQKDVNANVDITIEQKELAAEYAEQSKEYARQAKESADRASEVTDIQYATSDRAGIVAPQDIYVDENNGNMYLISSASESPLRNSYNGGLRFTEMIGESEQDTTTGTQLAKVDIAHLTNSSITAIKTEDDNILINGTTSVDAWTKLATFNATAGKTYTISCNNKLKINVWDDTANKSAKMVEVGEGKATFTATNTGTYIPVLCNVKSTVFLNVKADLMVNEGSEALPWEKYSGGKPAPNPDYPQEIKSVSISEIKTHSKNLLPQRSNSGTNNGVTFTRNADGSVTVNGTATAKADFLLGAKGNTLANLPNGKYTLTGCPKGGSLSTYRLLCWNYDNTNVSANDFGNGVTFEKTNTVADYNIAISVAKGATVNNLVFYPMLRYANVADDTFQPFGESVVTPTGFKLNGIGNVKDRLIRKDGVWQIERKVKSYTFTGNESGWNLSSSRIGSVWIDFYNKLGLPKAVAGANSFSSHFATVPTLNDYTKYGQALVETAGFNMWMKNGTVSGESEVKEFLANKNVTFSYVMETPTYEVLPLADQVAFNSLLTFDGVTYLDIESVLEPQFALEYGTSKVGGYTLQSLNTAEANQARIVAMETIANNLAEAVLQGEE